MKMLIGLLTLAISFSTLASTGESQSFNYDGSQNSIQMVLKGEKTHTEYRIENRPSICYRTEIAGYRTVCNGGGYSGPRSPRHPQNCYRQTVYRTVSYSCIEQVRVGYEVKDYDVQANVVLDVSVLATSTSTPVPAVSEKYTVTLNGDSLTVTAAGSKNYFIVLANQNIRSEMNGSVKMLDAKFSTQLLESASILKSLKMTNISLKDEGLTVKMGPVASRENIAFSLNVTKKRALASDITLFNRELALSETTLSSTESMAIAIFDITKLGVELTDGKYELTAKAYLKAAGPVLNATQFGDSLEASRTLIYKIR